MSVMNPLDLALRIMQDPSAFSVFYDNGSFGVFATEDGRFLGGVPEEVFPAFSSGPPPPSLPIDAQGKVDHRLDNRLPFKIKGFIQL